MSIKYLLNGQISSDILNIDCNMQLTINGKDPEINTFENIFLFSELFRYICDE